MESSTTTWAETLTPICQSLAMLLAPHAEVVLHDVTSDTIVGIWNPFSNRKVGDPALIGDLPGAEPGAVVMGPYEKIGPDGRRITSVSSVYADEHGTPLGVLCVNLDRSPMDQAIQTLMSVFSPPTDARPTVLFERDWREQISLAVHDWCREHMVDRTRLTRSQRVELVRTLDEADLFATRKAAQHVAVALGVSRATVYAMLREVRAGSRVAPT
jgi:D-arginine utilization repressor